MTGEKYIYERYGHYLLSKHVDGKNTNFGYFDSVEDAVFARSLLSNHNWDLNKIRELGSVIEYNGEFMVITVHEDRLKFLDRFPTQSEAQENVAQLINTYVKNPYNGKYGIYIYKRYDYYDIRRKIKGNDILYAYSKNLDDITFLRDLLMDYDWNISEISDNGPVYYSPIHNSYLVVAVINNRLVVTGYFDSYDDALKNAEKSVENYEASKYKSGEKYIVSNSKLFAVHYYLPGERVRYFGSFSEKIDAVSARDALMESDWDLANIDEKRIYEFNGYFWKFHVFEGTLKVIGKYKTHDDALTDTDNLSKVTFDDLYNPENPYSKINRNIWKRGNGYVIRKKIDGEVRFFGSYKTRQDAIEARDELEMNGWKVEDENSLFYSGAHEDRFSQIVSELPLWPKIIYDTIERLDKAEFTYDELTSHSYLKRYKTGSSFDKKVTKHLTTLIDLGLVTPAGDNVYRREF